MTRGKDVLLNWFLAAGLVAVFVCVVLLLSIVIWSARAGKQVRVLLDATGSKKAGKAAMQQMGEAGCKYLRLINMIWSEGKK